jgi:hypothetical protein
MMMRKKAMKKRSKINSLLGTAHLIIYRIFISFQAIVGTEGLFAALAMMFKLGAHL